MTHPGDNPFLNDNPGWVTDEKLKDLLVGSGYNDSQHDQQDEGSRKIMRQVLATFDECDVGRIVDTDQNVETSLQATRLDLIRGQIKADMLATPEGLALNEDGQLHAAVELRSQLALIATRKMHNYILQVATILNVQYDELSEDKKRILIDEFEDKKRIIIILMRDHYQLDMLGWPVAFDRATPGAAFRDGIDWTRYEDEAEQEAELMRAHEAREFQELNEMISLLGIHDMSDNDKAVELTVALAFIQEVADNIERLGEPNACAQIGEMIWEIGSKYGMSSQMCKAIASYYDGDSAPSIN